MTDIKGYKGLYAITKDGKVWAYPKKGYKNAGRWKEGRFLKTWLIGNGYKMVMLYKNKASKKFLVHRLVALNYIPNPKKFKETNHIDGNRLNNRSENLEWVDSKGNKRHAWKKGLYSHNTLTEKQIKEIRERYKGKGKGIKQEELAFEYKTTQANISWIIRGKGWSHVS